MIEHDAGTRGRAAESRDRQKTDRSVRDEEDIVEKRQTPFATVQFDAPHTVGIDR